MSFSYQHYHPPGGPAQPDDRKKSKDVFREFIKNFFTVDGDEESRNQKFLYRWARGHATHVKQNIRIQHDHHCRDALRQRSDQLLVDLHHVKTHDPDVGSMLEDSPTEYLPLVSLLLAALHLHTSASAELLPSSSG